ncbi:unnamed protein product [Allacma fusca]|uniref:Uncharacterized protein n=1 Tax=Allacma fusca TaxID=39272 RepID=A0A8J2PHE2_9HEXA|nr:unnamed protein product [Allacma fusca]
MPNGTWYEQMSDVIDGHRDVVFGSVRNLERDSLLDFVDFVDFSGLKFITSHPRNTVDWKAILYVFSANVWICLFGTCVSIFLFVSVTEHIAANYFPNYSGEIHSTMEIVGMVLDPLLERSIKFPQLRSTKLYLAVFWFLGALVIGTYYKSDFIAYVTYPQQEIIPRTFRELSERRDYNIKLLHLRAVGTVFYNTTKHPVHVKIRKRMFYENNWPQCVLDATLEEKTACISFDLVGNLFLSRNVTLKRSFNLAIYSTESVLNTHMSIGLTKKSKFLDAISEITRFLRDTGHIRRWIAEAFEVNSNSGMSWLKTQQNKNYYKILNMMDLITSSSKVEPMKLKNVLVSFIALSTGLFVSIVAFFFEMSVRTLKVLYSIFRNVTT